MSTFSSESTGDVKQIPGALESDVFVFPTSFAQQRLWFLCQFEPESPFYNLPYAIYLTGQLRLDILAQSFKEIIRRHEILRTTFRLIDGNPVQIITPTFHLQLPVIDLRTLPDMSRDAKARQVAREEAQHSFDLARGPLLRITLLRLADQTHILLLTMHHIISDGWSTGIIRSELSQLYEAFSQGKASPLPDLPIQYADFAVWQRQTLQGKVLQEHLDYWKRHLEGIPPMLDLPTDYPRLAVQTFRGASSAFMVPETLAEGLKALSQQEGATLFMTLLAAFAILLARYSGQQDVVIGTPIANRTRNEIENLIGFFVNTLVLRTNLSENPTFRQLVSRTQKSTLAAYIHQDLPFEKLVEELAPKRDLSFNPIFQVMFVWQNISMPALKLTDLMLRSEFTESKATKFDLTLFMMEDPQGLYGIIEYNTDLFQASTISRMAEHFQVLLGGVVTNPELCVWDLPLLTPAERQELLGEWNATRVAYPDTICIHQLFERQAELVPDTVAVIYEDSALAYGELNQQANQLAHMLQSMGIGPDVLVGIYMERSLEMIVAILATLKAGGAYVPLDVFYPAERLVFMLEDARISVVLTQQRLCTRLPDSHVERAFCIDKDHENLSPEHCENLLSVAQVANLAYVIYTSGSTGRPKGVMNKHRSLVNLCFGLQEFFSNPEVEYTSLITSINFDISVNQIFPTLVFGKTLCIIPEEIKFNPEAFLEYVNYRHLHIIDCVPSYLDNVLSNQEERTFDNDIKYILIGGERLEKSLLQKIFRLLGPLPLVVNIYGLTEIADINAFAKIAFEDIDKRTTIGRPLNNTNIYILDSRYQLLPVGLVGELCIAGDGVSRGYFNNPGLTAEKFVPNPFGNGEFMCKTGDLGRWLPDGTIEVLGRRDHQVKLRGYRIEVGEIESALTAHYAIQECVVLMREDTAGDKKLAAYVVLREKLAKTTSVLRRFLQGRLPDYMVPSTFTVLEELPLTPNGKLDRKALPVPVAPHADEAEVFTAPRSLTEEALKEIWAQVLGREQISIHDSFFEIGGHSLLITRIISRVRDVFQVELALRSLFEKPTIAELAEYIDASRTQAPSRSSLVKIQGGNAKQPFFLVHPAGGNVLCYVGLVHHLNQPYTFYGLQAPGIDGEQEPYTNLVSMAARYVESIYALQSEGPYMLGGWSFGGSVAFEIARQLQSRGQQVALLLLLDSWAPSPDQQPIYTDDLLDDFIKDLAASFSKEVPLIERDFQQLGLDEQLAQIFAWARRTGSLPASVDFPHFCRLFHIFKTNIQAWRNYKPQVYQGHVTLLRASDGPASSIADPTLGWGMLVTGGIDIHQFNGDHYTIIRNPQALADDLRTSLSKISIKE